MWIDLYHYTSRLIAEAIFATKTIRFTSIESSKVDDSEQISKRLNMLLEQIKASPGYQDLSGIAQKKLIENCQLFPKEFFIACFCRSSKNEYLWKNYAESKKGLCVKIRVPVNYDTNRFWAPDLFVMQYSQPMLSEPAQSRIQNATWPDFARIERYLKYFSNITNCTVTTDFMSSQKGYLDLRDIFSDTFVRHCISQKDIEFSQEDEVRLVLYDRQDFKISEDMVRRTEDGHKYISCKLPDDCFIECIEYAKESTT